MTTWITGSSGAEVPAGDPLARECALLRASGSISASLDQLPAAVVVVNQQRQIVYANRAFADVLHLSGVSGAIGHRLGNAVNCRHADEPPSGCGSTPFCSTCGARKVQVAALGGEETVEECRIVTRSLGDDLTLRVSAKPLHVGSDAFALMNLVDITDQKRREVLERLFFHDILNTAGGVRGLALLLADSTGPERADVATLADLAAALIEEVRSQRDLLSIERGEFAIDVGTVSAEGLLRDVRNTFRRHELARRRDIRLADTATSLVLTTDATLLRRVVGNMTKNALEACPEGGVVTLGCARRDGLAVFSVHNPAEMPREVQQQIFQRSFSTKGIGRGLGTYSMKLISERYLHGRVSFLSTAEGTTFYAEYPIALAG